MFNLNYAIKNYLVFIINASENCYVIVNRVQI